METRPDGDRIGALQQRHKAVRKKIDETKLDRQTIHADRGLVGTFVLAWAAMLYWISF